MCTYLIKTAYNSDLIFAPLRTKLWFPSLTNITAQWEILFFTTDFEPFNPFFLNVFARNKNHLKNQAITVITNQPNIYTIKITPIWE